MKILLSIWLSAVLLITGLPMPGMEENAGTEPAAVQEEADAQEKEASKEQETENDVPESDNADTKETGEQEEKAPETETPEQKDEKRKEQASVSEEKKEQPKEDKKQVNQGTKEENKTKTRKPEKTEPEETQDKEPAQEGSGEPLEAVKEEQAADLIEINLDQFKETGCLILGDNETIDREKRTGYHTAASRKVNCMHTAAGIEASVKCKKAANPLKPTRNELKNGVVLTGKLRGKSYQTKLVADDKGGQDNTVTHLHLEADVDAPGVGNLLLAGPYLCGDGYAAYAYFEKHYAYCPNTNKFYSTGESHVWLGCTRGDAGTREFKPEKYKHQFTVYKYIPNQYTVTYNANGGTGTAASQKKKYDTGFSLSAGGTIKRAGYVLAGWNTKADGTGRNYNLGQNVSNLTATNDGTVKLFAKWTPNTLTVKYDANGGDAENTPNSIVFFANQWTFGTGKKDPANMSSFGLSRTGYTRKDGAEWNTKANGTGRSFDQDIKYELADYEPDIVNGSRETVLFAQWAPNVYTVTLDNQLKEPEKAGTGKIYKKFETGLFLDSTCSQKFSSKDPITKPQKEGYQFTGYYDSAGELMIDSKGNPTDEASYKRKKTGNETWHARYDYMVTCEDYADIPCDLEKMSGDNRKDPGIKLTYNETTRTVTAKTSQPGCSIHLIAEPLGTKIGMHTSTLAAGSASAISSSTSVEIRMIVPDGAAYRVEAVKDDKVLCGFQAYYKDGRFRTLAKLGEQEAKTVTSGGSIAGSAWNKGTEDYDLYSYHGCSELRDVKEPGTVYRYFRYKDVNMAYSGDGATAGKNTLEYDVSLENMYQFRNNGFTKEKTETKRTEDNETYECKVRYSFQGWDMVCKEKPNYAEKEQRNAREVYEKAEEVGAISDRTTEDISTYQAAEPIQVLPGLPGNGRAAQELWEGNIRAAAQGRAHAKEYINFTPKWDSYPTITVTPGKKLEFYEGEEVTKEDLINCLTAHDNEDNRNIKINPNLNDKLRIVKIIYPEPENRSQAAYEKTYEKDVPEGFLLDTYYLKLEEDETVDVLVTFAVRDSAGNTTEGEIPVKVKYNHYPEISSEDAFYYLKEEANRGEITESALLGRASAEDEEDGDITVKIALKDFDAQEIKMQTQAKAEFDVTYQVTDAYQKTSYKTVKLMVWDGDAAAAEAPKYYVRYISEKYLDTLEENSTWREPENMAYLRGILGNETPMETWEFSHEDVLDVQGWITEGGDGNWKTGREANREFLTKFARCRQ